MMASHAQNPNVLRRARDLYATYCASSDGKNYQGLPCPAWDALTDAVRGHWYTVALRTCQLEYEEAALSPIAGSPMRASIKTLGDERSFAPSNYVLGHLDDPDHALDVWRQYSGQV